ncbi:MAG: PilZ domain-containing protein [Candidatus Methylomirabilales bacterium]
MASGARERRKAERFALRLPVELGGTRAETRGISATGVFIETDLPLAACSHVRFAVLLPTADPVGPLRLECQGHVVHTEGGGGSPGIGVTITSYRLQPSGGDEAARGQG